MESGAKVNIPHLPCSKVVSLQVVIVAAGNATFGRPITDVLTTSVATVK